MSSLLDRRDFLIGGGAGLGALVLTRRGALGADPPRTKKARPRAVIVGGFQTRASTGERSFSLVAIDGAGHKALGLRLAFHMHGFAPHPKEPWRAVLVEKKGPGGCEVDLRAGTVLRTLAATEGYTFYGHAVYSADGERLYATESRADGGIIAVRDGRTLSLVGQFPTYGAEPHDCLLVDGGRTLVITNGGGTLEESASPPCVTFVDVRTTRLKERVVLDEARWNTGHVAATRRRDLAVVSAPRKGLAESELGGVSLRRGRQAGKGALISMKAPKDLVARMKGETLSVCVHEPSSTVAATTPDANLVTFWNLDRQALAGSLELEHPRGVLLVEGGRYFAVSCGVQPKLVFVSTRTLAIEEPRTLDNVSLSSSHLYLHQL